jgi:hypothetical protein
VVEFCEVDGTESVVGASSATQSETQFRVNYRRTAYLLQCPTPLLSNIAPAEDVAAGAGLR